MIFIFRIQRLITELHGFQRVKSDIRYGTKVYSDIRYNVDSEHFSSISDVPISLIMDIRLSAHLWKPVWASGTNYIMLRG